LIVALALLAVWAGALFVGSRASLADTGAPHGPYSVAPGLLRPDIGDLVGTFLGRPAPPAHVIGVRPGTATRPAGFYDTRTGLPFVPRGNNYVRLDGPDGYHATFNPGVYDPAATQAALDAMHAERYNVVRVFINQVAVGNPTGWGLSADYLANVADFLRRAQAANIYTLLTFPFVAANPAYPLPRNPQIAGCNYFYLDPAGLAAKQRYLQDFITGLQGLNAPLADVFSYNIENEVFFCKDMKPLSLSSGVVHTANGRSYDMAVPDDRQRMMDENLVNWIDQVRAAVRQVDPTALVAPGFFSPAAVTAADRFVIRTFYAIADPTVGGSTADYIDLHLYLVPDGARVQARLDGFEIPPGARGKPLLLGELGAFKAPFGDDIGQAARALTQFEHDSCAQYGFAGWLLWSWDTTEQSDLFNAASAGGRLALALAPVARPDVCAAR